MQNEGLQSLPKYNFRYLYNEYHAYYFETSLKVLYEVKFKSSGYVFSDYNSFKERVFEFSIQMIENPVGRKTPSDHLISNTISAIFHDFFEKIKPVIIYICDTSDARGSARNRKFNSWFERFQNHSFLLKIDATLDDIQTKQILYTSLILRIDDPLADEIISAFRKLILDYQK